MEVPDILGFEHSLIDALGTPINSDELDRLENMVLRFCASYRSLDAWKLKTQRTRLWSAHEPCLLPRGPGVVLSVNTIRVHVRCWTTPPLRVSARSEGRSTFVESAGLVKIGSRKLWADWRNAMEKCGHDPFEWTTREFQSLAEDWP